MITLRGHHLTLFRGYLLARNNEFSFKNKKEAIIAASLEDGHSRKHGLNIIEVLEKAMDPSVKIKLSDGLDDICSSCNSKNKRMCREFIPYGESGASADRGVLYAYGLQKKQYTSGFIRDKIRKKSPYT